MSNKILFLDYDGVICHMLARWIHNDPSVRNNGYDIIAMRSLQKLQETLGFKVVCSSRAHAKASKEAQEKIFRDKDITLEFHDDWRTPYVTDITEEEFNSIVEERKLNLEDGEGYHFPSITWKDMKQNRGLCIQSWLKKHPEVTEYVVLDDESDMFPIRPKHFVHIRGGEMGGGLNMGHVLQIIKYFRGE